jgi:hypothetical protein
MPAFSNVNEAAAQLRCCVQLTSRLGISANTDLVKMAFERPENVAQALTW